MDKFDLAAPDERIGTAASGFVAGTQMPFTDRKLIERQMKRCTDRHLFTLLLGYRWVMQD